MALGTCWKWFRSPSARYSAGTLLIAGLLAGIIFWGGLHTAVEWSNSLEFCTSCHEMETTVFKEYKETVHYQNNSGVRAICSDCHVPREWGPKMWRKFQASYNELPNKILGTVDTPEKFEAHRLEMAERVWAAMRSTNSRECRNCHSIATMALDKQKKRAQTQHQDSLTSGETCIDCHQGIAHKKPKKEGEPEGGFTLGMGSPPPEVSRHVPGVT
ncbi:MAG: NapC/NirT family cytochrome c [Gammaproteobacteria bacterium]|jgi:nitrate/TMAO reductase-like tetraheme cytochrome c subunit|nr:NapC/NirT family cytochrome c [Gammaproteobacteria bacterium]